MVLKISVVLIMLSGTIYSAGFDCQKAKTALEKAVCSNTMLNSLDSTLSVLWKTVIKTFPQQDIEVLKAEQRYWLKERNQRWKSDTDTLIALYEKRIGDLKLKIDNQKSSVPLLGCYITIHPIQYYDGHEFQISDVCDYTRIEKKEDGKITFEVQLIGNNAHQCSLSGEAILQGGAYIWKDTESSDANACNLSILVDGDRIRINSINNTDCSYFCGAGLVVDGIEFKKCNIVSGNDFWW